MRIISDFKDYYDIGITDTSIVYKRNKSTDHKTLPVDVFPGIYVPQKTILNNQHSIQFIGFCGKIYIALTIGYRAEIHDSADEIYFGDDAITFLDNHLSDHRNKYLDYLDRKYYNRLKELVLTYHGKDGFLDIFRTFNTPIFIATLKNHGTGYDFSTHNKNDQRQMIKINPALKGYHFYKLKDSYTAFQEIQMFLSGVLGDIEKETNNQTDKEKLLSHGFDKTWSFRNPNPPKRKQKS